ncbi:retrovirus-related pol polyprotein from transposon TNT 1-94 [Tanacetum coccineum]
MVGTACLLTKITPATIVPSGNRLQTISILVVAPNAETRMRYSIAKNSLIRADINCYGHPFNKHNFAHIVEIVLWYLDSGCSKHMTGKRGKLINFVSKFIDTVKIGLGHNLFSVGQFCDSDLEVAFRKHTCFVRNLEGVDLLTGSCGFNLYTISMEDMMKSSPIFLLSKASKTKVLVTNAVESINGKKYILVIVDDYSRFIWVKFLRTKDETPEVTIKFLKEAQILRSYTEDVGITHQTSVARTPQQNGVVERRNHTVVEAARTMLIFSKSPLFLWAEAVATGPEPQPLTSGHISSRLVPNQAASTSAKPPLKNDLDLLFQLMFDEYFKPSPSVVSTTISVVTLLPQNTSRASSSTIIDQDAPSPKPNNEDNDAEFDSDTFTNPFAPLVTSSVESSSSRIVDTSNMHTFQQPQTYIRRWIKDHPLVTIIDNPSKPVFTRRQLATDAMWCYFHAFLTKVKPNNYKEAIKESSWIKTIGIFTLEMLKKYGLENSDVVDTPMVKRSKLDEDPQGTPVDPTHYRTMVGSLMYLTASHPNLVFVLCMYARYQAKPTEKYLSAVKRVFWYLKGTINMGLWYPKETGFELKTFAYADHADYGFDFNKIPLYNNSKSVIALSCNTIQHSRTKHIAARYHFIKEQVENKVFELYFVKTSYQLTDIFAKALARERFKFLINRLGMQSIMRKELKSLAESDEE